MTWLWLLPDAFLPVIIAGLGIAVMVRAITVGVAVLTIGALILVPLVIDGVVDTALAVLPIWLIALAVLVLSVRLLQTFAAVVIGDRATDEMTGSLAADVVRGGLWMVVVLPFRLVGWVVSRFVGLR